MDVRILDLDGALTAQSVLADGRRVVDGLRGGGRASAWRAVSALPPL